jgi:hypothetical protein
MLNLVVPKINTEFLRANCRVIQNYAWLKNTSALISDPKKY